MKIEILGENTKNRIKLIKNLNRALKEYEGSIEINMIENKDEYKNILTPALSINGNIVSEGRVVEEREIKKYIKEYA